MYPRMAQTSWKRCNRQTKRAPRRVIEPRNSYSDRRGCEPAADSRRGSNVTLSVAIGGFGAIGSVVARQLDRGIEGLSLAAVAARDVARAERGMADFVRPVP